MNLDTTRRVGAIVALTGVFTVALAAAPPPDANRPSERRVAVADAPDAGAFQLIPGSPNDPSTFDAAAAEAAAIARAVRTSATPTDGEPLGPNDPGAWFDPIPQGGLDCVCAEVYQPGDIVRATVDTPSGNVQILAGATGVVVCGRFFGGGEGDLVLVEWTINNGHDGFGNCDCPSDGASTPGTGWYVLCNEIELVSSAPGCVCIENYEPGDLVVAAVDSPQGNDQISAGTVGVVECGRYFSGGEQDLLLVRWNINNGHDGFGFCDCPIDGVTPDGTGWYVFCNEVVPYVSVPEELCTCGIYQSGDRVIAAIDNPQGNVEIFRGSTGTVVCGRFFGSGQGNENLVLVAWDDVTTGHDGFGDCNCGEDGLPGGNMGWYVLCDEIVPQAENCVCEEDYAPGDLVIAIVANPDGNAEIPLGATGTVRGGRFSVGGEQDLLLVEWNISNGHEGLGAAQCPPGATTLTDTGWYVRCNQIARLDDADCVCAQEFRVGDRVVALIDNPEGNAQIAIGDGGTVICGRNFLGGEDDLMLIRWDGVSNGHEGFGACDCGDDGLPAGSTDGWFVRCGQIGRANCSDADIDDDGVVGFNDLLSILSEFGDCFGCPEDVTGDDVTNFDDLLAVLSAWGPCP